MPPEELFAVLIRTLGTFVIVLVLIALPGCSTESRSMGQSPRLSESRLGSNAQSDSSQSGRDAYKSWIGRYTREPLYRAYGEDRPIELAITNITGDDIVPNVKTAAVLGPHYPIVTTTWSVSDEGSVTMNRATASALQGGGPGKLPENDFKRLGELIANIPDDHSRLPAKGRRLVVQVATPDGIVARVYDKANLPESVLEMLRLVGADAWPIYPFPDFQPDQRWSGGKNTVTAKEFVALGFMHDGRRVLATSPDGRLNVVEDNPSQYFDSTVHVERLEDAKEEPYASGSVLRIEDTKNGMAVREFRQAMNGRRYIYMYAARFTPDGRYLMLLSSVPDIRIYDTSTWQPSVQLPGIPSGTVAYYPSRDWKHGVAVFRSGETSLVEANTGRKLARIDFGNNLQSAVFSPDGSQVAVVTVRSDAQGAYESHLRIWATATGDLLQELRPLEATPRDGFGEPVWWPDGKYLLSLTREGHFGGPDIVGIWNAETGRYRGALAGCMEPDGPDARFSLEGTRFYKMCGYDGLMMWNVDRDIAKIVDFEKSLAE
jgi:hypothetical protein